MSTYDIIDGLREPSWVMPVTEEMARLKRLLRRVLDWRNMDGDGITDPLREDIKRAIGGEKP